MSNESERYEVYLTRYPSAEGRWQVSNSGGQWPHWSPKGDRLYFTQGDEIMEVEVSLAGSPTLGTPRRIVTRAPLGPQAFGFDMTFDVSPDGKQFLTTRNPGAVSRPPGLAIVQNWFSEFEAAK
jgi:serine/threonine-protein kinase